MSTENHSKKVTPGYEPEAHAGKELQDLNLLSDD